VSSSGSFLGTAYGGRDKTERRSSREAEEQLENGAACPWYGRYEGSQTGRGTKGRRSPWEEAVYGALQACTQAVQHYEEGLSQGAMKNTAGFRLFAKMRCADALEFAPEGALCAAT